ncbi:hypothetical protein AB833_09275 [Chromatiales bacterium (ex Bugula neritina AB1)]|nr:hypothetical protein AB833_09275 [Chromatiales bacterium (ex Bugula neritina AB1)]
MSIRTDNQSKASLSEMRSLSIFGVASFLITMILTAFIIIPKANELFESQYSEDIQVELALQAKLFTNFVDGQRTILRDLAQFPSLVNAAMLSDADNPVLIDLFSNVVIGGNSGRLVLQDISGSVLLQTTHDFQGTYIEGNTWFNQLLDGVNPYHFQLLSQEGDFFNFQMSIPVTYNNSIEGVLSAEVTVPLKQVFVAQSFDHVAFKLVQEDATVQTEVDHIQIAREDSLELLHPNLTFIYITDDAIIKDKERSLRNTILLVLLAGLGMSFLVFAIVGYRSLTSREKGAGEKVAFGRAYALPIAVGTLGITASITVFLMIRNVQQEALENELLAKSKEQVQRLSDKIHGDLLVLDSLKAFYDASGFVDLQEFRTFVTPHLASHPDIYALEWIPNVPISERIEHEIQAQEDGLEGYLIRERDAEGRMVPAGSRENYFPVYYVEPVEGNEKAIGYDLSSNSKRLATLTKASRSGNKVATAPIVLKWTPKIRQVPKLRNLTDN